MNNQNKELLLKIGGLILLVIVIISGILGIKHYMTEQTYEKPINAVIRDEHEGLKNKEVSRKDSKITVYDNPDEGNDYLIVVTFNSEESDSTITNQYTVDKTTNHAEYQGEQIPVSNLKKLYESDHLKK